MDFDFYTSNCKKNNESFIGNMYTDLATERRRADIKCDGVEYRRDRSAAGIWERIKISSEEGEKSIGRPCGLYTTLNLQNIDSLDFDALDDAKDEVARELCRICDSEGIFPDRILVVGLGNDQLTPDSVGCEVAKEVEPTLQISQFDSIMFQSLECSEIAIVCPGVSSVSGIESSEIVKGVCDKIQPDVIFAVDSIISRSRERVGTTIQFSSTGIVPGSGIDNHRSPIDEKSMGIPVIGIGVATVIDASLLIERDGDIKKSPRDMFVCPKDIQKIVKNSAKIIGGGINQAFGIDF